jgi:hypothetical protein
MAGQQFRQLPGRQRRAGADAARRAQARQVDLEEPLPGPGGGTAGRLGEAAHGPDERHDVAEGDAGVEGARRQRPRGELLDRGPHLEHRGTVGAALKEQVRVPGVPGEQRPEPAQQPLKALAARAGERLPRGRERLLEREPQQLVDQGVLAGEPPVQGAHAHPGPGGDLLHARVGAVLAEHVAGRLEDPVVVADRVAPPGRGPRHRRVTDHRSARHQSLPHSPSSLATVSPAAASPVSASPDIASVPTAASSPAAPRARRCDGISSPASAATTRTPAMMPNPVV